MEEFEIQAARRPGGKKTSVWRVRVLLKNLLLMCILSNTLYIFSRIWTTFSAWQQSTLAMWIALAVEVSLSIPHLLACLHQAGMSSHFTGWRESLRLTGSNVPAVDVFITYCGEGIDILLDTVNATCTQDYPSEKLHVYVLDDHGKDGLKESLVPAQKKFPNLHYECRGENVTTHSKAANLNYGMERSSKTSNADFMAVLDVDMIPEPCWLRTMLPHIIKDDTVAMSNPPQDFYNVPAYDVLGMSFELRWLSDVMMPMQDCEGKAWCTGSGFVVRRKAINDIGRYPTDSLQEDVLTSMLLSGHGWKVVHVHEVLQWGLSPTGLAGILKQRARLAAGIVSLAMIGKKSNGTSIAAKQKADSVAIAVIYSFAAIVIALASVVIPALMIMNCPLVVFSSFRQLQICFWLGILDCSCQLAFGAVEATLSEWRLPILNRFKGLWSVPHRVFALVETLAHGGETFYKPTGLSLPAENDLYSKPLWFRLRYVVIDCFMTGHLVIFLACTYGSWRTITTSLANGLSQEQWVYIMARLGWPPIFLFWTSVMSNAWVPLAYAIFTPKPAPRSSLLEKRKERDAVTPTLRAKENDKQPTSQWQAILVAIWVAAAGASFFIV